jgi:molecular chaperone GrpE
MAKRYTGLYRRALVPAIPVKMSSNSIGSKIVDRWYVEQKRNAMNNQDHLENQTDKDFLQESGQEVTPEDAGLGGSDLFDNQLTVNDLEAQLQDLQQAYDDQKDKHIRLLAEFDNFKRRSMKEKLDFMKTAGQDILTALLPVLDDFDRAQKNEPFSEGINLVYQKLNTVLKNKGLEVIESNGQPFNADFHEAVTDITAPSEDLKGKVMDTIEKGYMLGDKIIRYAKVVVGK